MTMSVTKGSQICTADPLVMQLVSYALDHSKEQKIKIGNQKSKIKNLKAKVANLKTKYAGKDEVLAQQRVESKALKAEVGRLTQSSRKEGEASRDSVSESISQKMSLDEARDEITRLQN